MRYCHQKSCAKLLSLFGQVLLHHQTTKPLFEDQKKNHGVKLMSENDNEQGRENQCLLKKIISDVYSALNRDVLCICL